MEKKQSKERRQVFRVKDHDMTEFRKRAWPYRPSFANEPEMHRYVVERLEEIEPGLDLYEDWRRGIEYPCKVRRRPKRLDVLAQDAGGGLAVLECKMGCAEAKALGQLLGYMGWVQEHLCCSGERVRGALVVGGYDEMVLYALRSVPLPIGLWVCRKGHGLQEVVGWSGRSLL